MAWIKGAAGHERFGLREADRHSLVLLMGGLVYMIYGLIIVLTWLDDGPRASSITTITKFAPLDFWGTIWVVSGFLIIVSSRWPAMSEKWGDAALTGLAAGWGSVYFSGLFTGENNIAEAGGGLIWGLVAFLWWAVAGLTIPLPPKEVLIFVDRTPAEESTDTTSFEGEGVGATKTEDAGGKF